MAYTQEKINALRQVHPAVWYGTDEEVIGFALYKACESEGIEPRTSLFYICGDEWTLESVQKAYELGYDAILNDGELIAFKKAV